MTEATSSRVKAAAEARFRRACALWDEGKASQAFRLFLSGAKAGDLSSQLNLGFFYDEGVGVRRNQAKALRWYRRAHRGGSSSAAVNIGILLRNQGRFAQAIQWFQRALSRGNHDSALQMGETYLDMGDAGRATKCFKKAMASSTVTDETRRAAQRHLREIMKARDTEMDRSPRKHRAVRSTTH